MKSRAFAVWALVLVGSAGVHAEESGPEWARVSSSQRKAAHRLGVPVAFENFAGMRFVLIAPGSFVMGGPDDEVRARTTGLGRAWKHPVTLARPFYLQTTEVTRAQVQRMLPGFPLDAQDDALDRPVTSLSVEWAEALANRVGKHDPVKRDYRLATEAEWEFACRGGTKRKWYWGNKSSDAHRYEHLSTKSDVRSAPKAVASMKPNPFGLYDMMGNVAEIVTDKYAPLPTFRQVDPSGPRLVEHELLSCLDSRVVKGADSTWRPRDVRIWMRRSMSSVDRRVGTRLAVPLGDHGLIPKVAIRVSAVSAENGRRMEGMVTHRFGDEERSSASGEFVIRPIYPWIEYFACQVPKSRMQSDWDHEKRMTPFAIKAPPSARRLALTIPYYTEVVLEGTVRVRGAGPVPRIGIDFLSYAGFGSVFDHTTDRTPLEPLKGDSFRLRGIPAIAGAPVDLGIWVWDPRHDRNVHRRFRVMLPLDPPATLRLKEPISFRRPHRPAKEKFNPSADLSRGGSREPVRYEKFAAHDAASVRLRCMDARGDPVVGAWVSRNMQRDDHGRPESIADLAPTDANGLAHFPAVPQGTWRFEVHALGCPAGGATLAVGNESLNENITLEARASAHVHAVREEGGPAAWAQLEVRSMYAPYNYSYFNIDASGVLHLEPRLDHEGRGTLHNLRPGRQYIEVRYFGRWIETPVDLRPGESTRIEVVVPNEGWDPGELPR